VDELEAMNMLLRAIGSSPVNSLETLHPDAVNARTTLNRIRQQAQRRGWWFNIDYCVAFTPDPQTGEVAIPDTISKVVFENKYLVARGNKLYDKYNQSYVFSGLQIANRVQYTVLWDDMPPSLQENVAYVSAAHFVRDELEDTAKVQSFREEAAVAMRDVLKDDLEQGQYNVFDKGRVIRARIGVRPYALHNSNIVGFNGVSQYG
tara:strand:+ start:6958 stop:7572 length:615 start_codon:yes stop_codon:yes gene_type:complete